MNFLKNKRAQEEMVGFAIILVIVAIIFIVLLSFYLRGSQEERIKSPEANSFLQAVLQYTTDCEQNLENLTFQKLIYECYDEHSCDKEGVMACDVLEETIKNILKESFGEIDEEDLENSVTKGYSFAILIKEGESEQELLKLEDGVVTNNYKGADQVLPPSRGNWDNANVFVNIYS